MRLPSLRIGDPTKSIDDYLLAEKLDLKFKHQALIKALEIGDVPMPSGSASAKLMGEITVATGKEVGIFRVGGQRILRLGSVDDVGHFILLDDVERVIAHTHPSGRLIFGADDIAALRLRGQLSSALISPDGTLVILRVPLQ